MRMDAFELRAQSALRPDDVQRILDTIHAGLFEGTTTATAVCRRCGFRNHNVHSRFKMVLGVGIREYIERERVRAAEDLLRDSNAYVYEVADAVGYTHAETFVRAFRRQSGCTPGEYRERALRVARSTTGSAPPRQGALETA